MTQLDPPASRVSPGAERLKCGQNLRKVPGSLNLRLFIHIPPGAVNQDNNDNGRLQLRRPEHWQMTSPEMRVCGAPSPVNSG